MRSQVHSFHDILRRDFDLPCTVRQEKGQEIAGACGQLVVDRGSCGPARGVSDIEELAGRLAASVV